MVQDVIDSEFPDLSSDKDELNNATINYVRQAIDIQPDDDNRDQVDSSEE